MTLDRDLYAADAKHMADAQRRRRERALHRRSPLSPLAAGVIAGGALALAGLIGRRYSPDRSHPDIDRWYHGLEKPPFTPPDQVFGAVWPALEVFLAVGGYRLLRESSSPERTRALALWFVNVAMIAGWPKVFFGERSLGGGLAASTVQLGASLAYVESATRLDPVAAAAGIPYAAWVAFANVIAEEVWRRNERQGDEAGSGLRPATGDRGGRAG